MFKIILESLAPMLIVMLILAIIGAFCWPYALNTWLTYLGKEAMITWWQGAILGFLPVIGYLTIPVAVITWILMLFL